MTEDNIYNYGFDKSLNKISSADTDFNAEFLGSYDTQPLILEKNTAGGIQNIFSVIPSGENEGDVKIGDYDNSQGILYDKSANTLYILGGINVDHIDIGGDDATSAHIDTDGNQWWGASVANKATAPSRISNTGSAVFTDITLTGLQAGSSIDGTYITALSVSKLSTGTISSKKITLGITAGTGDTYIASGKTDFGTDTAGFILGLDDSDGDLAKFEIGSSASKHFRYDGTDIELIGAGIKSSYTAGENISAGDTVCLKNTVTNFTATEDSYVYNGGADTNYGTENNLYIQDGGANVYYTYILFDISSMSSDVGKCYLNVYQSGYTGDNSTVDFVVNQVTATWSEAAVTWNNKPAQATYAEDLKITGNNIGWISFDITNLVRKWKNGSTTNYGVVIRQNAGTAKIRFGSSENAGFEPYLSVVEQDKSDEKVYLAQDSATDAENYNLCRNIVGIAAETKTTDQVIKVYDFPGSIVGESVANVGAGANAFVSSTAGEIINDPTNVKHLALVGIGRASGDLLLKPERPYFIERYPISTNLSSAHPNFTDGTTFKLMPPRDAMKAVINIDNGSQMTEENLTVYRVGRKLDMFKSGNAIESEMVRASWANDIITLTVPGVSSSTFITAYYYTK